MTDHRYHGNNDPSWWRTLSEETRLLIKRGILIAASIFVVSCMVYIWILVRGLPDLTHLENVTPAQMTQIYSEDGKVIHKLFKYNRIWIPYEKIDKHIIEAALSTEDRDFMDHWGINLRRVPKAIIVNLIKMRFAQGFSTISMQVARNLYQKEIGFERNINRKLREILTALLIERTYSKQEILGIYLNVSYFGRGAYGIRSAAKKYFAKEVSELNIEESALLVGLLKGPALFDPFKYPIKSLRRRNVVLNNMWRCGFLTRNAYDQFKVLPVPDKRQGKDDSYAPYFTEFIRVQLNKLQDSLGVNIYRDGLKVFTTLHTGFQSAMDSAIAKRMPILQKNVTNNLRNLAESRPYDSTLVKAAEGDESGLVQIAFIALDHKTGHIKAMVGGRDFQNTKFNRAIQARRQPGSTFKPFLYTSALDNGYTVIDEFLNQPIALKDPNGVRWTPENFNKKYSGLLRIREALRRSLNVVAARLILEITPPVVVDYARRLGITTPLNPYPSLAMGSATVNPMEMISAYGVFANGGVRVEPISIIKIEDRNGNVIYQSKTKRREVLNREAAYLMTSLLEDNIRRGTGGSSRWKYRFMAPAGGKTGTTNDHTDAWFIGYTPQVTAGVWVGLDSPELKLGPGQTGASSALPFWATFMKVLYDDLKIPHEHFKRPTGIVELDICNDSGKIATNFCPNILKGEVFKSDTHPTESCDLHPGPGNKRRRESLTF